MTSAFRVAGLLFALSWLSTSIAADPTPKLKSCPPLAPEVLRENLKENLQSLSNVHAIIGVDILGRVLVAIDADRDSYIDDFVLFTDKERLKGPWSRDLQRASIVSNKGALMIEARDKSILLSLAVEGAEPFRNSRGKQNESAIVRHGGIELVRQRAPQEAGRQLMSSFSYEIVASWPESFHEDLLRPRTAIDPCVNCEGAECTQGGCGANACSITQSSGACQVSCSATNKFACCRAGFISLPTCRCILCIAGPP
jgi:hypothetical protein